MRKWGNPIRELSLVALILSLAVFVGALKIIAQEFTGKELAVLTIVVVAMLHYGYRREKRKERRVK